jgi:2-polyprenyl-3-methyl-5-hydroxy-6-metoxy-1,4-benzoquinol methylase
MKDALNGCLSKIREWNRGERPGKCFMFRNMERSLNIYSSEKGTPLTVLDVACQTFWHRTFFPTNMMYTGVDKSAKNIEACEATFGKHPNMNFIQCDLLLLGDALAENFDVVVSTNTLEHIDKDGLNRALCELINRSSRRILISYPNHTIIGELERMKKISLISSFKVTSYNKGWSTLILVNRPRRP